MISSLKKMFGLQPSADFAQLVKEGAQIVDVRTRGEFAGGHIKGSVNIPVSDIGNSLSKIRKDKPVIVCCASGMRSASAASVLKGKGYTVYNGGGWSSLQRQIQK